MVTAITIPAEYGYVIAAATVHCFVNVYHSVLVSGARKASGVKYPAPYATNEVAEKDPKAFAFNCAQRAHSNYLENLPTALLALFVTGLRYPVPAAAAGVAWALARVIYARGYYLNGPAGRGVGAIAGSLIDVSLKLATAYTAFKFIF